VGLSLVRCPLCDRRYNVTGIPPGTKVLCTSCRAILTVPGNRFVARAPFWARLVPRSGPGQAVCALLGGLLLATGSFFILREAQAPAALPPPRVDGTGIAAIPSSDPDRETPLAIYQVRKELPEDKYTMLPTRKDSPFVLFGEKTPDVLLPVVLSSFEGTLPKLAEAFRTEFGEPLGLDPIPYGTLPIVVYTRRETYEAWWREVFANPPLRPVSGVFSYVKRRVSLFYDRSLEQLDAGRTREVLLHEAIHEIIDYYTRKQKSSDRPGAWWFQEGMGTYFESFSRAQGGFHSDGAHESSRLPMARELVRPIPGQESRFVPLRQLLTWNVDDIWNEWLKKSESPENPAQMQKLEYAYAQSWAFVHFLCHASDGLYRPFFLDYFRTELTGRGGWDEFRRLLEKRHPELDLNRLENLFKDYILNDLSKQD